jgi:HEPN domain-containing protein
MRKESEDPRAWFAKAEQDWKIAQRAIEGDDPLPEQCCYHAQQCAEKYLKGYLKSRRVSFKWIHDLRYLVDLSAQSDGGFSQLAADADTLTRAAEPSRYPGDDEDPVTVEDAKEAIQIAARVRAFVRSKMGI